ncbi:MAG: ABC transporter ATP-binding protein [Gemmatimonadota bacterium]
MIVGQDLRKVQGGRAVLDGATVAVHPGEHIVLTGNNGSGKTTLLHLLVGLRRPDAGEVRWKDTVLTGAGGAAWSRAREAWGFLPQHPRFPEEVSPRALARHHARLRGVNQASAMSWIARVGLEDTADRPVEALSGGMRQRLGIALTLFHDPELIVMDEPASSLDAEWREALAGWLAEAAGSGAGVLITSQDRASFDPVTLWLHCALGRVSPEPSGTRRVS